jgi:hypothetical protein
VPTKTFSPADAADRLDEMSADARAVAVLDAAGSLAAATDSDPGRSQRFAELSRELFERADAADDDPPEQVEVQVPDGAVFALRSPRWMFAVVAERTALPSLMFYDMRSVADQLEHPGGHTHPGAGRQAQA